MSPPHRTTPEEGLAAITSRFGVHAGHRALHAKGVICTSAFTATPAAAALTRAGHMTGETIPVTTRLSNGSGDPTDPDWSADVRGLATAFHVPDGTRTDILAQTLPHYAFPDERERVIVGTLEVTAIDREADDAIVMDPMRVVDGIEPSGDPVLNYRPPVYDLSYRRRTGR